ncbi:MAG: tetratricopeptide repeat protein [Deltaproteobacteria bacterium]|nr:tetratricopeptide repeat protein [Deltaproteobacteria bacterium]
MRVERGVLLFTLIALAACSSSARRDANPGIGARARTLEAASMENALRGDLTRAASLQERAVAAYRSIDDVAGVAAGLNRLGNLQQSAEDRAAAERSYGEARDLARLGGASGEEAAAENNLGTLVEEGGDTQKAREHYEAALRLAHAGSARSVEAAAENNLGLLALAAGDLADAQRRFDAALAIDREIGDRAGEATRLRNLGALHRRKGSSTEAIRHLEQAHEIDRKREDVAAIALDLVSLSEVRAESRGDLARAVDERRRARDIHRLLGDREAAEHDEAVIEAWCGQLGSSAPLACVEVRRTGL